MNDELETLLRNHYRAAADEIHADPATFRRFQEAGRAAAPARGEFLRRWTLPMLAAAATAAALVVVAVLLWPRTQQTERPRPLNPPVAPASPTPGQVPTPTPTRLSAEPPRASTIPTPQPSRPQGSAPARRSGAPEPSAKPTVVTPPGATARSSPPTAGPTMRQPAPPRTSPGH